MISSRLVVSLLALAGLLAATWLTALLGGVASSEGCGPASMPEWNDKQPSGVQLGGPPPLPLRTVNQELTPGEARSRGFRLDVPANTLGRERRFIGAGHASVIQVYANEPVPESDTFDDVIGKGAIYVYESPREEMDVGLTALRSLGERAAEIKVGPHTASFSHASPDSNGNRSYRIYWSDKEYDHMVAGMVSEPTDLIDVARSMACEG